MDKIYSRKRIRFPNLAFLQSGDKKDRKKRKIVKIGVIFCIAIITANLVIRSITPIFDKLCEAEAKSIATKISNQQATEVMKNYRYQDLVTILKDNTGNVTAIKSNIIPINEIISDVAIKIQDELNATEEKDISIRLGSFTGSKILSGRGPKVKIRISSVGDVETDFKSEFKEGVICILTNPSFRSMLRLDMLMI